MKGFLWAVAVCVAIMVVLGSQSSATPYSINLYSYESSLSSSEMEVQGFSMFTNAVCKVSLTPKFFFADTLLYNRTWEYPPVGFAVDWSEMYVSGDCVYGGNVTVDYSGYMPPFGGFEHVGGTVSVSRNTTTPGNVNLDSYLVCEPANPKIMPINIYAQQMDGIDGFGNLPLGGFRHEYAHGENYYYDMITKIRGLSGNLPVAYHLNYTGCGAGTGDKNAPAPPDDYCYNHGGTGGCLDDQSSCRSKFWAYPFNASAGNVNITLQAIGQYLYLPGYLSEVVIAYTDPKTGSVSTLKQLSGGDTGNLLIENQSYNWSLTNLTQDDIYYFVVAEQNFCMPSWMSWGTYTINESNMNLTFEIDMDYLVVPSVVNVSFVSPSSTGYQVFSGGVGSFSFNISASSVPEASFDSIRYQLFQDSLSSPFYESVLAKGVKQAYVDVPSQNTGRQYFYRAIANATDGVEQSITDSIYLIDNVPCIGLGCDGGDEQPVPPGFPSVPGVPYPGAGENYLFVGGWQNETFYVCVTNPSFHDYAFNASCRDNLGFCNSTAFNTTFGYIPSLINATLCLPVVIAPNQNLSGCFNSTFNVVRVNDSYSMNYVVVGCYADGPGSMALVNPSPFIAWMSTSETKTKTYTVNNTGTSDLTSCYALLDGDFAGKLWWSFSAINFSLAAGADKDITLTLNRPEPGLFTTTGGVQIYCMAGGYIDSLEPSTRVGVTIFAIDPVSPIIIIRPGPGGGGGGGGVAELCGDKICSFTETSITCPQDCQFSNQTFIIKQKEFSYPTLPFTYQDSLIIYNPNQEKLEVIVFASCVESDLSCEWVSFGYNGTETPGGDGISVVIDEGTAENPAYQVVTVIMRVPRNIDVNLNFRSTIKASSGKHTAIVPYTLIGLPAFGPFGYLFFNVLKFMLTRLVAFPNEAALIGDGIYVWHIVAAVAAVLVIAYLYRRSKG